MRRRRLGRRRRPGARRCTVRHRGAGTSGDLDGGLRCAPVTSGAGRGHRARRARLPNPVAERGDRARSVRHGRTAALGDVHADGGAGHRQHLRARRDDDRRVTEDAGRGLPGPLPARPRRQQPGPRREGPRPRLRQAAVVHEDVPGGDGSRTVQRRRPERTAPSGCSPRSAPRCSSSRQRTPTARTRT